MGTTSSKSTLLKHQQSQENLDSGTPERYYHRRSPSNTTTSSSQRSLATKFHQKSNSSKLLEVEPGRMSPSGSSCGSKTKGILGKIKKKKRSRSSSYLYDGNMAASVSSVGSLQTCSTLDDESTIMGATEAATSLLLARYDHEKDAFLSQTASCAPCIVSQTPELRLSALKLDCSDITPQASTGHSCDTAYTTTSTTTTVPVVPFDANMYRIDCERYTKEWLATPKYSGIHKGLSSQEVVMDLFLQPNNEADRRKEKDRQQRLHYLLKRIWKSIYRAPLENPTLIVNWCCGIGVWDMEMAAQFPEAKIVGVDFKEATLSNLRHGYPNLEFKFTVIHDTTTGLESFEDNSVDMVMLRDTWLINSPSFKWCNILKESFRILKPGGYIEIEEQAMSIVPKGPYIAKLFDWYGVFYEKFQVDRSIAAKLTDYLERMGYENIDEQAITIPLGEWASTPDLKETGFLYKDLVERRLRGLSKWVCELNNITMDELNHAITQVIEEEVDKYHSCIDWLSFTARKPKDAQCDATFSPAKKERPVHLTEFASTSVIPLPPPPSTQSSSRASTPNH